jgi:hypothetical protein
MLAAHGGNVLVFRGHPQAARYDAVAARLDDRASGKK